jgi:DNA-binding NarL/FixJ family response regulator
MAARRSSSPHGSGTDVILPDTAMPRRSGPGALPELVQVGPEAEIIVLSDLGRARSVGQSVITRGTARSISRRAHAPT